VFRKKYSKANSQNSFRVLIHRCAACSVFDHFEIQVNTNLEVIERTTYCTARCCAAVDMNSFPHALFSSSTFLFDYTLSLPTNFFQDLELIIIMWHLTWYLPCHSLIQKITSCPLQVGHRLVLINTFVMHCRKFSLFVVFQ
jgi:hypothetical protein